MRWTLMFLGLLLTTGLLIPMARAEDSSTSATLDIFYTGKRRSNLEPCGCRSKQASGVQYEATLYERLAATSASLRLDAGEWTNIAVEQYPVDSMKTRYLLRALALMRLEAVGVGQTDTHLSPAFFKSAVEKTSQGLPNLVSANVFLKAAPEKLAFAPYRIVKRRLADGTPVTVGITAASGPAPAGRRLEPSQVPFQQVAMAGGDLPGVLAKADDSAASATQAGDYLVKPAREALLPVVAGLRPKVDLLVVLYSGSLEEARSLARGVAGIDCLVTNGQALGAAAPGAVEGKTVILPVTTIFGREVGRARLRRAAGGGWSLAGQPRAIAVNPEDFKEKKPLSALIEAFKKETQSLEVKLPGPNVEKIYGGAQLCARCHQKEVASWQKTPHARALPSLVDKGQQFNPECLRCHVTGYRNENGFYTVSHAPSLRLAGVQCEICHGPARDHADTEQKFKDNVKNWMEFSEYQALVDHAKEIKPPKQVAETTCKQCHTPENDGNFSYSIKHPKVKH